MEEEGAWRRRMDEELALAELELIRAKQRVAEAEREKILRTGRDFKPLLWSPRWDIDSFLCASEGKWEAAGWKQEMFLSLLLDTLNGEAEEVYVRMVTQGMSVTYDTLCQALRKRFGRDSTYYRKRFRTLNKSDSESFVEYVSEMTSCAKKWFSLEGRDVNDPAQVWDMFMEEQMRTRLEPEYAVAFQAMKANDIFSAAAQLDEYVNIHTVDGERVRAVVVEVEDEEDQEKKNSGSEEIGMRMGQTSVLRKKQNNCREEKGTPLSNKDINVCWRCGSEKHRVKNCTFSRKSQALQCAASQMIAHQVQQSSQTGSSCPKYPQTKAKVDGRSVLALRDTGADACFIKADLVSARALTGRQVKVAMVDGTVRQCPTAVVGIESPYIQGQVEAVAVPNQVQDVLIGNTATFCSGETLAVPVCPQAMENKRVWYEQANMGGVPVAAGKWPTRRKKKTKRWFTAHLPSRSDCPNWRKP